jgi:diacylglycerol kinase family enzyme
MRIALVYNPSAGEGSLEVDELHRLLEELGHEVKDFGRRKKGLRKAMDWAPDVLAIAGGDGTVARAAIRSFKEESTIPLFILPLGTANNIAHTLGLDRAVSTLLPMIETAKATRLDIGRVNGPWGKAHFVEAAGVGFIGTMLHNPLSRARRLASSLKGAVTRADLDTRIGRGVAGLIREQPLRPMRICADGEELSGAYVAAEAMNIRRVGPGVTLAPQANPGDGFLDLVLVTDEDREALADTVERRATHAEVVPVDCRRVREVEIWWEPEYGHVDDKPWPHEDEAGLVTIGIAGAVTILLP